MADPTNHAVNQVVDLCSSDEQDDITSRRRQPQSIAPERSDVPFCSGSTKRNNQVEMGQLPPAKRKRGDSAFRVEIEGPKQPVVVSREGHPGENIIYDRFSKRARAVLRNENRVMNDDGNSADCILLDHNSCSGKKQCPRCFALVYIDGTGDTAEVTESMGEALHTLCNSVAKAPNSTIEIYACCSLSGTGSASACHPGLSSLLHVRQNDQYSCGYRNTQVLLSALAPWLPIDHPYYGKRGGNGSISKGLFTIPSLRQLQETLEAAWASGLDPGGAQHYSWKIVGKTAWIGAVEVWSMFTYWKVDACIVQFIKCPESRKFVLPFLAAYFSPCSPCLLCSSKRPTAHSFAEQVLRRAERNASNQPSAMLHSTRSCSCPMLPLYLQWRGHSITVVGVESDTKGGATSLIALDPKQNGAAVRDAWNNPRNDNSSITKGKPGRLPASTVRNKDIQIIVASPGGTVTSPNPTAERATVTAAEAAVKRAVMGTQSPLEWQAY